MYYSDRTIEVDVENRLDIDNFSKIFTKTLGD